jgi:hypothetical protein
MRRFQRMIMKLSSAMRALACAVLDAQRPAGRTRATRAQNSRNQPASAARAF